MLRIYQIYQISIKNLKGVFQKTLSAGKIINIIMKWVNGVSCLDPGRLRYLEVAQGSHSCINSLAQTPLEVVIPYVY